MLTRLTVDLNRETTMEIMIKIDSDKALSHRKNTTHLS